MKRATQRSDTGVASDVAAAERTRASLDDASAAEVRRFAAFLRAHRDRIVREWIEAVREANPLARRADPLVIENNLPALLDRIAAWLEHHGERIAGLCPELDPVDDLSHLHAVERLAIGYDVRDVIDEYRILRRTILRMYRENEASELSTRLAGLSFFHESLDLAVGTIIRHHSEERQRQIERWRLAAEAAEVGTWDYDPRSGTATWDARAKELFGLAEDAPVHLDMVMERVHPDDRPRVEAALASALHPRSSGEYACEFRVRGERMGARASTSSECDRWLFARGRVIERDAYGAARRMVGTTVDVGERKRAERERELFVAAIGHDLRNPLTAIKAIADRLARGTPEPSEAKASALKISATAERMARMISELLDFSRSQLGALPLDRGRVDFAEVFREAVAEIEHAHPDHHVSLKVHGVVTGDWDRERMLHVAQNLLTNAVKYGDREGPIRVELKGEGGHVTFSVHNQGPPIAPALLATIFDAFSRASPRGEGLGLGLHIVRRIVEAHGGAITVHSDEASGTTFSGILPRRHG